jgi:SAM-dependent methyltransferase
VGDRSHATPALTRAAAASAASSTDATRDTPAEAAPPGERAQGSARGRDPTASTTQMRVHLAEHHDALTGELVLRHVPGRRIVDLGVGSPAIAEWVAERAARLDSVPLSELQRRSAAVLAERPPSDVGPHREPDVAGDLGPDHGPSPGPERGPARGPHRHADWPPDASTPDAGTPDAGTPDTGTPDTGTPDTGTPDAGTPDTGTPDAGAPDTGTPDAGAPRAGVSASAPLSRGDMSGPFAAISGSGSAGSGSSSNLARLPLRSESYDVALVLHTLPHLGEDAASSEAMARWLLAEAARVVRPGGVLLVDIANPRSLSGLVAGVRSTATVIRQVPGGARVLGPQPRRGGSRGGFAGDHALHPTHDRDRLTRYDTLARLHRMAPSSLEDVEVHGIGVFAPRARVLSWPVLGGVLRTLDWAARDRLFLRYFGARLLVVLRKLPSARRRSER